MKKVSTNTPTIVGSAIAELMNPSKTGLKENLDFKIFFKHITILAAAFIISGCGSDLLSESIDIDAGLTRDEFKQGLAAEPPSSPEAPPPIPQMQPIITTPALDTEINSRRVTLSITDTTPLRDVFIELAREAQIDFELDPRIEGGVIFTAYNRPFDEVLKRLSDLARLRYSMKNGVLRIELDEPYHITYPIAYLNIVRTVRSEIGTTSSVTGEEASGRTSGESSTTLTSDSINDFWNELEINLKQIMTNTGRLSGLVAAPAVQSLFARQQSVAGG